jgi:hypothetical protein
MRLACTYVIGAFDVAGTAGDGRSIRTEIATTLAIAGFVLFAALTSHCLGHIT